MSRETRRLELWTLARTNDGMGKIVIIYREVCGMTSCSPFASGMINAILEREFPKPIGPIVPAIAAVPDPMQPKAGLT
jgi:hypothetical protein